MTGLFGKITDQMIVNCKDCITGKDAMDALWEKVGEKNESEEAISPRGIRGRDLLRISVDLPFSLDSRGYQPLLLFFFLLPSHFRRSLQVPSLSLSPSRPFVDGRSVLRIVSKSKTERVTTSPPLSTPPFFVRQDPQELVRQLESCLKLNEAHQEQYRLTKTKLQQTPRGKQFDFSETEIFGEIDRTRLFGVAVGFQGGAGNTQSRISWDGGGNLNSLENPM